jgi:PAS domain S-box-containing protein
MRLSAQEYELLVEQAPIMIWRAGLDARCDWFNERWLAFTGRALEDELGDGWAEGVHPEDLDRCVATYRRHFDARMPFLMEYRLRRYDGAWRWISDRGVPFDREPGVFGGFIGSCVDVTERVEAQRALEQQRKSEIHELRALLPMCASCKSIRDDAGYWERVERYIESRSTATFTHTFCPACAAKLYP